MGAQAQPSSIVVQDAGRASKLEAIASSGACEAGRVVALDFAAVRAAIGDHWLTRCEDVHSRIEREIEARAPGGSIFLRITDSEYLVSFSDAPDAAAQRLAFSIMEELLNQLLGKCDPHDLIVKGVSSVTVDGLEMRTLSRADVETEKTSEEKTSGEAGFKPPEAGLLIESLVERLKIRLDYQDVIHLKSGLNIGNRISISLYRVGMPHVLSFREEYSLSTNSLLQTTLQAIENLRGRMDETRRPAVFVLPLFVQTMISSRGRTIVLDELRRFRSFDQRRLIVELSGIEPGTPSSRLMETSWQLRPFCRAVTGRAQLERSALNALSGARLSGVHLSARDLGSSPSQRAAGLLAAGQSARNLAPMVMAVDLPDRDALNVCAVAGFTHATLPSAEV